MDSAATIRPGARPRRGRGRGTERKGTRRGGEGRGGEGRREEGRDQKSGGAASMMTVDDSPLRVLLMKNATGTRVVLALRTPRRPGRTLVCGLRRRLSCLAARTADARVYSLCSCASTSSSTAAAESRRAMSSSSGLPSWAVTGWVGRPRRNRRLRR